MPDGPDRKTVPFYFFGIILDSTQFNKHSLGFMLGTKDMKDGD